jgi:hypothetical protein
MDHFASDGSTVAAADAGHACERQIGSCLLAIPGDIEAVCAPLAREVPQLIIGGAGRNADGFCAARIDVVDDPFETLSIARAPVVGFETAGCL